MTTEQCEKGGWKNRDICTQRCSEMFSKGRPRKAKNADQIHWKNRAIVAWWWKKENVETKARRGILQTTQESIYERRRNSDEMYKYLLERIEQELAVEKQKKAVQEASRLNYLPFNVFENPISKRTAQEAVFKAKSKEDEITSDRSKNKIQKQIHQYRMSDMQNIYANRLLWGGTIA